MALEQRILMWYERWIWVEDGLKLNRVMLLWYIEHEDKLGVIEYRNVDTILNIYVYDYFKFCVISIIFITAGQADSGEIGTLKSHILVLYDDSASDASYG